jgi:hypothetical protein
VWERVGWSVMERGCVGGDDGNIDFFLHIPSYFLLYFVRYRPSAVEVIYGSCMCLLRIC